MVPVATYRILYTAEKGILDAYRVSLFPEIIKSRILFKKLRYFVVYILSR